MMRDCYLHKGERLVFEGEGWGIIVDDGDTKRTYVEGDVYGTHQACTTPYSKNDAENEVHPYGDNCWEPAYSNAELHPVRHTPPVCRLCDAAVPEGIQALILMQAWGDR